MRPTRQVGVYIDGSGVLRMGIPCRCSSYLVPCGDWSPVPLALAMRAEEDVTIVAVVPCVLELLGRDPSGAFMVDMRGDSAWHRLFPTVFIVLN